MNEIINIDNYEYKYQEDLLKAFFMHFLDKLQEIDQCNLSDIWYFKKCKNEILWLWKLYQEILLTKTNYTLDKEIRWELEKFLDHNIWSVYNILDNDDMRRHIYWEQETIKNYISLFPNTNNNNVKGLKEFIERKYNDFI